VSTADREPDTSLIRKNWGLASEETNAKKNAIITDEDTVSLATPLEHRLRTATHEYLSERKVKYARYLGVCSLGNVGLSLVLEITSVPHQTAWTIRCLARPLLQKDNIAYTVRLI
jgi:hypothetical protein